MMKPGQCWAQGTSRNPQTSGQVFSPNEKRGQQNLWRGRGSGQPSWPEGGDAPGPPVPDHSQACLPYAVSQQPPCEARASGPQMRKLTQDPTARGWCTWALNLGDLASQPRVQAEGTADGFLGAVGDRELQGVRVHKRHFCPRVVKSLEGWRWCQMQVCVTVNIGLVRGTELLKPLKFPE